MSDHFEKTIDAVIEQVNELEREIARKKLMVNDLCELAGRSVVYATADVPSSKGLASLTPDAFYGKKLATAVREVLERRKAAGSGAATATEIYDALVQGGYHFETKNDENAKRGLYQSLTKNSSTFHKLPNGTYGLREWYPAIRTRSAAGQQESSVAVADEEDGIEEECEATAEAEATTAAPVEKAKPKPR